MAAAAAEARHRSARRQRTSEELLLQIHLCQVTILFCACSLIQQGNWKKRKRNVHLNGTWCKTFGVLLQWRKNVSQIFHLVYLKRSDSLKSLLRFNSLQKVVVCNENFIEIYFSTKKLIFHFFQKSSQISTNDF